MKANDEPDTTSIPTISEADDSYGEVTVNLSVVANIVRIATLSIPGVHSVGGSIKDQVRELFSRRKSESGVRVTKDEAGHYEIAVRVVLKYGVELGRVGGHIQEAVRNEVSKMTSNEVSRVDVIIDGIEIEDDEGSRESTFPSGDA
jgi:uncharacterized alkaline shock family protein YloU